METGRGCLLIFINLLQKKCGAENPRDERNGRFCLLKVIGCIDTSLELIEKETKTKDSSELHS